jgi:rhomboid family GlyGly-CTERM serine protease
MANQLNLSNQTKSNSLLFIGIGLLCTVIFLIGEPLRTWLLFEKTPVVDGELWRVITGHLIHTNHWHLLLNLASLTMIGMLFQSCLTTLEWLLSFIGSALFISICYLWLDDAFDHYMGLSAVLYGVIIIGALFDLKAHRYIASIILVVVTGRVIWQQLSGGVEDLATLIEARVAIESHFYGICSGYFIALVIYLMRSKVGRQTE